MADAAEVDASAAPPFLPDPAQVPEKVAEEILRQAQKLIDTQIAASNALDTKLNAIVQQCITLTLAALAGAASAFVRDAWLPVAAAIGLMFSALLWSLAAGLALQGLSSSEIDAPARRARRLWRSGIADVGTIQTYALIAAELDNSFVRNRRRAAVTASLYKVALTLMVTAPIIGVIAALTASILANFWWPIPILLVVVPACLPGLWRQYRSRMRSSEGLDDDVGTDGIA